MILSMPAGRILPTTPGASDPFFPFVTLLLHMDGLDESQDWPDAIAGTIWERNSSASTAGPYIDSDQSVFGNASTRIQSANLGVDTGEFIRTTSPISGHQMETSDFVIEGWFRPIAPFISVGFWWSCGIQNGENGMALGVTPTTVWWRSNSLTDLSQSVTIPESGWTHIAWVREGSERRIYVAGTLVATDLNGNFNNLHNSTSSRLGAVSGDPRFGYQGWIDEVRITKGSTRGYTGSTISVPTEAFPNS